MPEGYRPVSGLSRTLIVMLVLCGAQGALGALLGLVQGMAFPELAGLEEPQTGPQTAMMLGVACHALLYLFVYIATIVVFGMFIHRSCHNAHALGARGMEFTPGWAVGWYFIPFLNLFKPYQAAKEIYCALDPDADSDDWRLAWVPGLFGWWWAAWITSNVVGGISGRLAFSSDPAAHAIAPWVDVADGLLDVALCTLAALVVRLLTARQEKKARVASFA